MTRLKRIPLLSQRPFHWLEPALGRAEGFPGFPMIFGLCAQATFSRRDESTPCGYCHHQRCVPEKRSLSTVHPSHRALPCPTVLHACFDSDIGPLLRDSSRRRLCWIDHLAIRQTGMCALQRCAVTVFPASHSTLFPNPIIPAMA